jgi:ABC-type sugar transport system permease subunit
MASARWRPSVFWQAVKNTVVLWWGHIIILFLLALGLALVLDLRTLRGRTLFRTVYFSPYVMGTAAVALAFGLVFNTDYGPLNALLGVFGIGPIPWMTSPDWTKPTVIIFNIWQITGFWMLILLAGLQGIDRALHEAAMIDGANALQRTWHVTIPGLAPVLAFAFIMETMGSIRIFTQPFILFGANGGSGHSALTITMYLYNSAFGYFKFGYAAAIGWVLFAALVVVSAIQVRATYRQTLQLG